MASVNFLYRSTKPKAFLNLRLLLRIIDEKFPKGYKDFSLGGKTKLEISKQYWEKNICKYDLKEPITLMN